ncbi:hypothetical protein [Acidovorax sp.]|uniref:hypothetical protein n=1 Tax=Acidovorax sp. TaxID=1872122 RepID=UPI002ACE2C15|nr:hypothetical protein [Acidovorax sp.]MDZ7862677.1 hypothetical protein [Acidovorax sp.]
MSVVINPHPAFWAPGHLVIPDQPDKPFVFKYKARFRHLSEAEQKDLDDKMALNQERQRAHFQAILKREPVPKFEAAITDKEIAALVLVDWEGFTDAEKKPVPYTPAARDQACADTPGLDSSFCRAYLEARNPSQVLKDAEKNSEALPATT